MRSSSWDVTIHEKTRRPRDAGLDASLVEALLAGDESAFGTLVNRDNLAMSQLAWAYVPSRAIAEEVAQEAWLAMVRGLSGFKGQSSLKTWLFGILLNHAKTKGTRESRSICLSALETSGTRRQEGQGVDWLSLREGASEMLTPVWGRSNLGLSPEDRALSSELRLGLEQAISLLPAAQRAVVVLRDVEGWTSGEVCDLLGITPENQRVRLHRARLRIRKALESYLSRT